MRCLLAIVGLSLCPCAFGDLDPDRIKRNNGMELQVKVATFKRSSDGLNIVVGDAASQGTAVKSRETEDEHASYEISAAALMMLVRLAAESNNVVSDQSYSASINMCETAEDPAWPLICTHWRDSLTTGAIINGSKICCSAIPEACRAPGETCSEETCMIPSCEQEEWYLNHLEARTTNLLTSAHINPVECAFFTAKSPCGDIDADVGSNKSQVAALIHGDAYLESTVQEAQIIKSEIASLRSSAALVETSETSFVPSWNAYPVARLEWWVEPVQLGDWDRVKSALGVVHSFLIARTHAGDFRMEKTLPYDVLVRKPEVKIGQQLHAAVEHDDLRPGLTLEQVASHFTDGQKYDVLESNCHQAVGAAFAWAAPDAQNPGSPNSKWLAALHMAKKVAPQTFNELAPVVGG